MSKSLLFASFIYLIRLSLGEDAASQDENWPSTGGFMASPRAGDSLENGDLLAVESQQYETKAEYAPTEGGYQNERMAPKYRRRKHRYRPVLRYGSYPSYDYKYDNEYIDRIDRDGVPASSGYGAPNGGYGPSTAVDYDIAYEPQSSGYDVPAGYEAPSISGYGSPGYADNSVDGTIQSASYDDTPSYSGNTSNKKSTFSSFLNALAAFLPIGLFLAAIPPNLIVINNDTTKRKRSAESDSDSMILTQQNIINRLGVGLSRLQETECQKFLACEMAVTGKQDGANRFQRALSSLAYYTPEYVASYFNTLDVLQAIQTDDCSSFSCHQF